VLTDVRMPEASGPELCRALKSRLDRLVPVLLFSSLPDPELGALADQCGADGFVSKHNGLGALRRQLEQVCEAILW
jgi:DNA-binding NarL/FixJ family response regulator